MLYIRTLKKVSGRFLSVVYLMAGIVILSVCACSGGGSSGGTAASGGSSSGAAAGGASSPSSSNGGLFAVDQGHQSIGVFDEKDPVPGTTLTGRVISGISLLGPSIAYDPTHDALYATSSNEVVVFSNARTASGTLTPARTITPSGFTFDASPVTNAVYLDKQTDTLYVGGDAHFGDPFGVGAIAVFKNASTLNGSVVPDQILKFHAGVIFFTVDTSRSIIYLSNHDYGLHVLKDWTPASDGYVRTVDLNIPVWSVAIDQSRDRLYIADQFQGVHILDNASTANASSASSYSTVTFSTGSGASFDGSYVSLDENADRLYVGGFETTVVLNHASGLTGGAVSTATAAVKGPAGSSIAGIAVY